MVDRAGVVQALLRDRFAGPHTGGSLLGAIGASGAPGGREDEACAAAGIAAIRDDLDME